MDTNESCLSQVMLKESDGLEAEAVRGSRKMWWMRVDGLLM